MSRRPGIAFALFGLVLAGCHTDMWRQPRAEPLGLSEGLFTDGAESRPLMPGTVPRDHLREDSAFFSGIENGKWVSTLPVKATKELLMHGRERYDIFCSPCHGRLGDGNGMIARRGFALRRPVGNYHTERLRNMPIGHFYDVITNGYGAMYSYASRIEPQDRWAIAAYIRVLQHSQNATPSDFDEAAYAKQQEATKPHTAEHGEGSH